jgi:26S proteasome regulatory subunit N10
LGKRLKRNNVAVDIINFANPENVPKLEALVNAANNSSNSHFLDVPLGISMITDVLFTSPILGNEDMPSSAGNQGDVSMGGGAGQFAEYGGINPDLDPDLAMALKVSMEEERARQKEPEPASTTT